MVCSKPLWQPRDALGKWVWWDKGCSATLLWLFELNLGYFWSWRCCFKALMHGEICSGLPKGGEPLHLLPQFCAVGVRKLHIFFPFSTSSNYMYSLTFTFSGKWPLPSLNSICMWTFPFLWQYVQRSWDLCVQAELIETSILKCDGLILIMCGKSSMCWGPLVIQVCEWPGKLLLLPKNFLSEKLH